MKKVLFVLLTLIFVLSACGTTAPAVEAPGAEPQGEKTGDLILAVPANSEPASFDGHIDPYQSTWLFNSFVADSLIVMGPDGNYYPDLATSWETTNDGNSWIFHLRDDVTFQDGTPFNAEAVKYNMERAQAEETASAQLGDDLGPIVSIDVVDEFTVQVNYEKPWVTMLDTIRRMPLWSPTAAEEHGVLEFDKHLVGTGPFTFEEWVPNDHVTLKRWEDYGGWNSIQEHEGAAYLNSVTIKFIGEETVLGNLVKTGDAHIVQELPTDYIADYENSETATVLMGYQAGTGLQMVMNTTKAPLDQLDVRKALLYATDQEAINDDVFGGKYLPMEGPINSVHPCYWDGAGELYPVDLEKAKTLLEGVGWKDENGDGIREAHGVPGINDGTPLEILFTVLHHEQIGEALQIQWKAIGVDLKVEIVPGPVQLDRVTKREFDLIYERQRSPDPRVLHQVWHSSGAVPGGWAWSGFQDDALDEALENIAIKTDIEERCGYAVDAQKIVLENALLLPTLSQPVYLAVSNSVEGFKMGSEGNWFFLNDTYVVKE